MMTNRTRSVLVTALAVVQTLAVAGCSDAAFGGSPGPGSAAVAAAPAVAPGPVAVATLKELMDSTVDPAADGLWDSVAVTSTLQGTDMHQPRTPEEWAAVRRHAVTLIEAMNLVVLPGRHAAPPGTKPGPGELAPAQIESGIAHDSAAFAGFARALQETARKALNAIDRKDTQAMIETGGDIDAECEACHVTFWYPNQR